MLVYEIFAEVRSIKNQANAQWNSSNALTWQELKLMISLGLSF
jgi:hypothetical protein